MTKGSEQVFWRHVACIAELLGVDGTGPGPYRSECRLDENLKSDGRCAKILGKGVSFSFTSNSFRPIMLLGAGSRPETTGPAEPQQTIGRELSQNISMSVNMYKFITSMLKHRCETRLHSRFRRANGTCCPKRRCGVH